jgi:hypothetical protein
LAAYGVHVIPFVAGDLNEVIQAWLSGGLEDDDFAMPGCCGSGRLSRRGLFEINGKEYLMKGRRRGGVGPGGRLGQGRGGQGRSRQGGPFVAGPSGFCVCLRCGQREPHELGVPCVQKRCPKCGTVMTRE